MSTWGLTPAQAMAMMKMEQAKENQFIIEAFTLLSFAVAFVALRTISRLVSVGIKRFQLDDYLMLFAITLYGIETGAAYIVGAWFHGLANNGMVPAQRRLLSPSNPEYDMRIKGSKIQVIGWNLYTLLLWTLKMCMCVFYARLTNGLDHFIIRIRIGYGLIVVSYLAVMLSILFGCYPLHKNWQIYPNPGNFCQPAISRINCLVTVILNVLTDLYLMSIPLPLMWKTQMPIRRKILLTFMFSGGIFVIACGILRCALILIHPVTGAQQAGSWAVRETFVAVIIGNIPMVYQLFRRMFRKAKDKVETSRNKSNGHVVFSTDNGGSRPSKFHSYALGSKPTSQVSRKSRFRNPLSLDNTIDMENDEYLQLDPVYKKDQCVITTEFSVETETTSHPSSEHDRNKTGWVGERT